MKRFYEETDDEIEARYEIFHNWLREEFASDLIATFKCDENSGDYKCKEYEKEALLERIAMDAENALETAGPALGDEAYVWAKEIGESGAFDV
jgi:hypothetical protein